MQSRKESLHEVLQGVLVGYIIAVISQLVIFPLAGVEASFSQNLIIGFYFTLVSVVRGYVMRRYHNKKLRRRIRNEK